MALEALGNLAHRGAVNADGKTGDGTGLLTQLPEGFFGKILESEGIEPPARGELAVGMFFFPRDDDAASEARRLVEQEVSDGGLELLTWRQVPTHPESLGELARRSCPDVVQALVSCAGRTRESIERRLFLVRRRIEKKARLEGLDGLYPVSFSHRTLVYKAMSLAPKLADFYPDLRNPDYRTALALFHQRFSTNTEPTWHLAQPFRMLAHNGEINTIAGNVNWMEAREQELESEAFGPLADQMAELVPLLQPGGSDSAMLDNVLEILVRFGRDPLHSMAMLIPEAASVGSGDDPEIRAFNDYHSTLIEPWDGPAAVVFSDGRLAAAILDRNGLRPQRYWITRDGLVILGSETGIVDLPANQVIRKGRLGPGQLLAVDTGTGRLLENHEIRSRAARRRPYAEWVREHLRPAPAPAQDAIPRADDRLRLRRAQVTFGYSRELMEKILDPMLRDGRQPVGSMGDDTPLAVLSRRPQLLYSFFKQRFSQVTNPPIDSLRESLVMSLETMVGPWGSILGERAEAASLLRYPSPLLGPGDLETLLDVDQPRFQSHELDTLFPAVEATEDAGAALEKALDELCRQAEEAVDAGAAILVLRDDRFDEEHAPIPMLLATSAVHHHLIRRRKRMQISIVCDTSEPREDHHFACLIGFGATLVHPRLALLSVADRAVKLGLEPQKAISRYLQTLEKGLLKIMAKLGVCPISSYQGAQLFEALGLEKSLVDRHFTGAPSRIGGAGFGAIAYHSLARHGQSQRVATEDPEADPPALRDRGWFRFRQEGEHHHLNPPVFKALHKAVRSENPTAYKAYSELASGAEPTELRDFLAWRRAETPAPLEEVETATEICRRFVTSAMSLGALSREAHEALAVAMNRIGGRSNSGEGGEADERFRPYTEASRPRFQGAWSPEPGDWGNSAIKQVASGRFGVTPDYLVSAEELEIKIAQGSKPGEGGQIPAHKVTMEIAGLRRSVPGVRLISPPPHHDIYSIEDLAQLIFDLRQVHPEARIAVKLVACTGIGTIAAGVAKARADVIHISGDSGGTGASPLSSIKHAGLPWELGLAEVQQTLVRFGLRERVTLRVDGGLRNGRDVVLATLLGADELAFGTVPLIALGCVMARQCHLNTCPVGIASQEPRLRQRFRGTPDHVVSFMAFVAEEVRHILSTMGCRSLDELVGRAELLQPAREVLEQVPVAIDVEALLYAPKSGRQGADATPGRGQRVQRPDLGEKIWREAEPAIRAGESTRLSFPVCNRDRSLGARLAGHLARESLRPERDGQIEVELTGTAGQSFGAFLPAGVSFHLHGDAQDYVGKSLAGGEIVLAPPAGAPYAGHLNVIAGNTLLYGATSGALFAAGQVGERFCVRNSGATAVVEGCGVHGCEYMTGGRVVILGPTGANFGAGMSGGVAYVYDPASDFAETRLNRDMATASSLEPDDAEELRDLLRLHAEKTGSRRARAVLEGFEHEVLRFVRVAPILEAATASPEDPAEVALPFETQANAAMSAASTKDG